MIGETECSEASQGPCSYANGMQQCQSGTLVCALQMQRYCNSVSQDVKAEHTGALMVQLANWAVASRQMQDVIKLPLDGLQEQVGLWCCSCCCCPGMHRIISRQCDV